MNLRKELGRYIAIIVLMGSLGFGFLIISSLTLRFMKESPILTTIPVSEEKTAIIEDSYDLVKNTPISLNELDDFIKSAMIKMNEGIQSNTLDSKYTYLNQNLLTQDEWVNKESLADYSIRLKKIKKMQRLASYISSTYKIRLVEAEKIVYISFVEANRKNLEPTLVLSLIGVESTFKQFSQSDMGAVGLTQVMPNQHAKKIANLKEHDIWSVNGNIKVGTDILKEYIILSKGNLTDALQRYNGSLGDETFSYSNKVLNKMHNLNNL